jgi:hypothetical protein
MRLKTVVQIIPEQEAVKRSRGERVSTTPVTSNARDMALFESDKIFVLLSYHVNRSKERGASTVQKLMKQPVIKLSVCFCRVLYDEGEYHFLSVIHWHSPLPPKADSWRILRFNQGMLMVKEKCGPRVRVLPWLLTAKRLSFHRILVEDHQDPHPYRLSPTRWGDLDPIQVTMTRTWWGLQGKSGVTNVPSGLSARGPSCEVPKYLLYEHRRWAAFSLIPRLALLFLSFLPGFRRIHVTCTPSPSHRKQ